MTGFPATGLEISAKVALAVAAVCDRHRFSNKFGRCRRSKSAATGLLQRFPLVARRRPQASRAVPLCFASPFVIRHSPFKISYRQSREVLHYFTVGTGVGFASSRKMRRTAV